MREFHDLEDYAIAFAGFDRLASGTLGGGSNSVVLRLEDGNVLKLTTLHLPDDIGQRSFDLPLIERGSRTVETRQINFFVQPFAEKPKPADLRAVASDISLSGYQFEKPFLSQVGRYQERSYLLDPFAVAML